MTTYRIRDGPDPFGEFPPGWINIETSRHDGMVTSTSWAPPEVDPAIRLNPDYPSAEDWRGGEYGGIVVFRLPNAEEWVQLALGSPVPGRDVHVRLARHAIDVGAVTLEDALNASFSAEELNGP